MASDSSESSAVDAPPAPTPTSAPMTADVPYDQLTVNLNVISPTTTATSGGPLSFPNLPVSTTILQLKEKIRDAVPSKPADTQQRLIYRGRHLQADNDTLGQIIGEATIREHDLQAFHLVLRGIPDAPAPTPSVLRGRVPTPGEARPFAPQIQPQNSRQQSPLGAPTPDAARRTPGARDTYPGFAIPTAPNFTPQQVQQMHSQLHQSMSAWSSGLQREAVNRAMANHQINQNQSTRAAMGMHGIGDNGIPATGPSHGDVARGRSPGGQPYTRTVVREGTLGDGQPYRVTNTETWTPLSVSDVQGILRGADAGQATQAMTNAMQRSESPVPGALPFGYQPGTGTPYYPTMGSRAASRSRSRRGTPDPGTRSVSEGRAATTNTSLSQRPTPSSGPEVYILSSPQGPRALLINNSNNETYYTPSGRLSAPDPAASFARFTPRGRSPQHSPWPAGHFTIPPTTQPFQAPPQQGVQPQPQNQQQAHDPHWQAPPQGLNEVPVAALPAHPNNPRLAPFLAQMLPHFWLMVRLGVFIWWFTSPNSSWSRWVTVVVIAISIFIVNTGLFDAYFDQVVGPIRRHLDNLLPLAHNNNNNAQNNAGPAQRADGQPPAAAAHIHGPPDPAQAAVRLVAQRRHDNANWLMDQARRLERAGLLFLASIAPGVAERHIAHLEEQERAERRRREEAEAAATAAAAAADGEQEPDAESAAVPASGDGTQNETPATAGPAEDQQGNEQPPERREVEPLIAV
ncbi:hypothetical protein ACHAQH_008792 [Verticillium albo-atrum]